MAVRAKPCFSENKVDLFILQLRMELGRMHGYTFRALLLYVLMLVYMGLRGGYPIM